MKIYFFISNLVIILILINCSSDIKRFFPKTGIVGLRNFLDSLDPERRKSIFIYEIIKQVYYIKTLLDLHNDRNWVEDSTQFGMKENGKAFNILANKLNIYKVSDARNLFIRRIFYLSFEYDETRIKNFGMILNKIIETVNDESNDLLKDITNVAIMYARSYFVDEFRLLLNKVDKLQSLELDILQSLKDKFDQLAMFKKSWNYIVNSLIRDFLNNKNNIQNDKIKLILYINKYYKLNFMKINNIEGISNDIKAILAKI
ncbi:complement regulator-acquiring protein [Borrelia crocidurae]|uniref:Antigen P35-like protein n=1 Tax=Borrelia crocidurae (strain Achema) TaxID=1155096 RepID=I0FE30_BORCA|nr:complement regulator-acquiring protein [Borrelia crocidurae]AFI31736.1 Antigen P35-like protein [Borrelia crocidurae str. Achema]